MDEPVSVSSKSNDAPSENYGIKNLVFEGGGVKGLAYVGALRVLEAKNILPTVENVGGASAGSMTALTIGLSYSTQEVETILGSLDFMKFLDGSKLMVGKLIHAAQTFGAHPGKKIYKWLADEIIAPKMNGNRNATFADLHAKVIGQGELKNTALKYRDLHFVGANLSTGTQEIFSYYTTPDMPLADAVRISISIPLFFEPCVHQKDAQGRFLKSPAGNLAKVEPSSGQMYVDGGVVNNFPVEMFDCGYPNPQTLGFRVDTLLEIEELRERKKPVAKPVGTMLEYGMSLFSAVSSAQAKNQYADNFRTIYIDIGEVKTTQFNLNEAEKQGLLKAGEQAAKSYFTRRTLKSGIDDPAVEKDKKRHEKYDRYKIYQKASAIFISPQTEEEGLGCLQFVFELPEGNSLQDYEKKIKEYYRRLAGQRFIHHLRHEKTALAPRKHVLTLMVEKPLLEEARDFLKGVDKNRQSPVIFTSPQLIKIQERKGAIKPDWMRITCIQEEKKRKLIELVSSANIQKTQEILHHESFNADIIADAKNNTLLHIACQTGRAGLILLLLEYGARLDTSNHFGDSVLHTAVENGNAEAVKTLLSQGIDSNLQNKRGETALLLAAKKGNIEILLLLIAYGANPGIKDHYQEGVLHKLAFRGDAAALSNALEKYPLLLAELEIPNKNGETPLHIALKERHYHTSSALSKFSVEDIKKLKPLLGPDFQKIEKIDPENPEYKKLSFTQEEILAIKKKLLQTSSEEANHLSDRLTYDFALSLVAQGANLYAKDAQGKTPWERISPSEQPLFREAAATRSPKKTLEFT